MATGGFNLGVTPNGKLNETNSGGPPAITAMGTGGSGGVAAQTDTGMAIFGNAASSGAGVTGLADTGFGVQGFSIASDGVHGTSAAAGGSAVAGINSGGGHGGFFQTTSGIGVFGTSTSGDGVHGESAGAGHNGVAGINSGGGRGGFFQATSGEGVFGTSTSGDGVHGESAGAGASAVAGIHTGGGHGVFGQSKTGDAGFFQGNVTVTGNATVKNLSVTGQLTGDVTVEKGLSVAGAITTTDVTLTGGDCAEEFDALHADGVQAGMVVVFDQDGRLSPSETPYDRRVAGVISGAGSFKPGVVLDRRITDQTRVPVALIGKVYCRADASGGPISVGDLLTTSGTHGHAMRAQDPLRAFGAVIGKALGNLDEGLGLIPILVAIA